MGTSVEDDSLARRAHSSFSHCFSQRNSWPFWFDQALMVSTVPTQPVFANIDRPKLPSSPCG